MADRLFYAPSKLIETDGGKFRVNAEVFLGDECRNKHCDFSFTGTVKRDRGVTVACGAIHDEIALAFPELKKFLPLHMCNYLGHPVYAVENGQYFIREGKRQAMNYLRITEEEYEKLSVAGEKEEKPYFKYLLYSMGIVDRWKSEADEFIAFLEEKTGKKWVNPYKPDEERVMRLTDEERADIEKMVADGYYTEEAMEGRKKKRERDKQMAIRNEVIERYNKEEKKAREERDIMLYLFDNGMPIDNVIFYDFKREVVFNWLDYRPQVTLQQFEEFVSKVDYSKLPENIKFKLGKDK